MKFNVESAKNWVVLAVYLVILATLLRPGGQGQTSVSQFGESLAGLVGDLS